MDVKDFPFTIMDVVSLLHLNIRRRLPGSIYTDCPICGDRRGKLNVNTEKNVWHCNHCNAGGGMLGFYASVHGITTSDAYFEICEALSTGDSAPDYQVGSAKREKQRKTAPPRPVKAGVSSVHRTEETPTSLLPPGDAQAIHQTLSTLLGLLSLSDYHQQTLRGEGMPEDQIRRRRSTPPAYRCQSLMKALARRGCTFQDVPGFYLEKGKWSLNFHKWVAGILKPVTDENGLVRDIQIRLNKPIRMVWDDPEGEAVNRLLLSEAPMANEVIVQQSERATDQAIHQTFSMLLGMLSLTPAHRRNLLDRGLTDEQIDKLGYKSTPPTYLCRSYAERLLKLGCTLQGVPGFYIDDEGKWTVRFPKRLYGILVPCRGIDGLVKGAQIRLDVPIKDPNDDPEKEGTKYLWLSTSMEYMGVGSGSPVHFIGDPYARVVYVTEGLLKADVAHYLMNRTFASTAGANITDPFDALFAQLKARGTKLIVEAEDMDKHRNESIANGASKTYLLAQKHGLDWRPLTWNPNYKGVDDWQLALKKKAEQKKEARKLNFKERYLAGECGIEGIEVCVDRWHELVDGRPSLPAHLGLTDEEMTAFIQGPEELEKLLRPQRREQGFRIYQLDLGNGRTKPFAYSGIKALHKAGYEQPPAAEYRLVYDGRLFCAAGAEDSTVLERVFDHFNDDLPNDYYGRSVSPSDVLELYDADGRRYFYCDGREFVSVKFSPALTLPMKKPA